MKRNKLMALVTASAMGFLLVGTVLAATGPSDEGVTPTEVQGNITIDGEGGSAQADCDAADAIATGNSGGSDTSDNDVTVTWTYDADTKEFGFTAEDGVVLKAYIKGSNSYNVYDYTPDGVTSDGGMFAPDNESGGPAGLSHAIFCTGEGQEDEPTPTPEEPTPTPTFSGGGEDLTEPPTDTFGANGTANPADSAWLLVVALGVLLASIVVLTPARAKSRR